MPFILPADPVSGAIAPVTWGDDVRNALNFLANPPGCRVYHNAAQSVPDNTEVTVAFNSERYDTDAMHDTVTNNGRITFNTAGRYVVGGLLEFAAASDYVLFYGGLRLNGVTSIDEDAKTAITAAATPHIKLVTTYKFAVGDYVEFRVFQDNSANLARNLLALPNRSPEFWASWIGLG